MLISRNWLQTHVTDELPSAADLEHALTFHAFEIDGIEEKNGDAIFDVKVTPNRGHDCLCHIGIAKELSAILKLSLVSETSGDGAAGVIPSVARCTSPEGITPAALESSVAVSINTPLCSRYIATHIRGVKVGPSPEWLKTRLESIGQRSINNVVDATNYVMFDLGQPLHAFDAGKLKVVDGRYAIAVRTARAGEKMLALDEQEYTLNGSMLVIADANADSAVGIAGVKGGMPAGITGATTDIILEAANFDGAATRKTAQALKLRTDASSRFEQVISPELAAFGMDAVIKLILELAGGEVTSVVDVYPTKQENKKVTVSVDKINRVLGITLTGAEVADVFQRLRFAYKEENGVFEVVAPEERLDVLIPEDLIEEVGRIVGYDRVPEVELQPFLKTLVVNKNFYWSEKIRESLISQGFSEVFTSVFAEQGQRVVLNKVDGVRPYLRSNIAEGLYEAFKKNIQNKDVLGLKKLKIFEIGPVWENAEERIEVCTLEEGGSKKGEVEMLSLNRTLADVARELGLADNPESYDDLPLSPAERYHVFSRYPYIVRDVAFWSDGKMETVEIEKIIKDEAGELCTKISLFDRFEKEGKVSLAYRLIFQSFDRTLTDDAVQPIMEKVYAKLVALGFVIR